MTEQPTTGTAKIKLHNGNYQKLIEVAHGQITQEQFADYLKTNTTVVSRNMNDWLKQVIVDLQSKCNRLQARETDLQEIDRLAKERETHLQAVVDEVKRARDILIKNETVWQQENNELQAANTRLQAEVNELQAHNRGLKGGYEQLQGKWDAMYGQIKPLRGLGSAWAVLLLSILIVSLDFHALNSLLEAKTGGLTAVLVSLGLSFALLVFTASKDVGGRRLAIFSTFIIVGLFMDALQATANIFQAIANGSLPANTDLVAVAITVISPWMNKELTSMLNRKELDQSELVDWGKVWGKIKSFFKFK